MNKKIIAVVLSTAILVSTLCGCGSSDPLAKSSKSDLIKYARELQKDNQTDEDKIKDLEGKLKGIKNDDVQTAAITEFSDGTGRLTLTSLDKIVKLPEPFTYPNSIQSYNASTVEISDNITIKPSSNWVVSLTGTEVQFEHENGIYGVVKIGSINDGDSLDGETKAADLQNNISEFFTKMPPDTIKYNKIYVDTDWMGMDACAHTFINEKDAQIRCGMLGFGQSCITYLFAYTGAQDSSKDELVVTLLQTMKILDKSLRVE